MADTLVNYYNLLFQYFHGLVDNLNLEDIFENLTMKKRVYLKHSAVTSRSKALMCGIHI